MAFFFSDQLTVGSPDGRRIDGLGIIDIAPMILQLFGLPVPKDMEGKALASVDL